MSRELPITFEEAYGSLKPGDILTIDGVYKTRPSGRKWWQFWKPRLIIDRTQLEEFKVIG